MTGASTSVWISRLDAPPGSGPRLAVKDAIDVAGVPTTAGCAAVADVAAPANADAPCVATARAAGARVVGKTNLHELCFGTSGKNPWFGTPANPVAPDRVPGGSSSGSAVAVAIDDADVGYGTDTGGSVRIPAACCGIAGLKTTWQRISTEGVWPLAPSLDTVGPLARDVAGVVQGMRLLEPGFDAANTSAATVVGRLRLPGVDPDLEAAVDRALAQAELEVIEIELDAEQWERAGTAFEAMIMGEVWISDGALFQRAPDRIGDHVRERVALCEAVTAEAVAEARVTQGRWQADVADLFERVQVLALPTLVGQPPELDGATGVPNGQCHPWNLAGVPALSLPVPVPGWPMPGSIQLVGPHDAEALLCATGAAVESAIL